MLNEFETVVGLEIHVELATRTKLLCACRNAFGAPPNTLCCPVCLGLPGALPTLNRQAVEYALRLACALHCDIPASSAMARKNYFYPDLPKGYQITQDTQPLGRGGWLEMVVDGQIRRVDILRVHIEEDAAKLQYAPQGGTLVDLDRCGVPLAEIVCAPQLHSANEARAFAQAVARLVRCLGISQAKMQEGGLRADVNVSVRPAGSSGLGVRTELKNLNSFGAIFRAVRWEAARQTQLLQAGKQPQRRTLRWDDAAGTAFTLRDKEQSGEYRFFTEPDLLPFAISPALVQWLRDELPELPIPHAKRLMERYGLLWEEAFALVDDKPRAAFFEACAATYAGAGRTVAAWLLGEVTHCLHAQGAALADTPLTPQALCELLGLIDAGQISAAAAKTVLRRLLQEGGCARTIALRDGLLREEDQNALRALVAQVLAEHPAAVADIRRGKAAALDFLLGQCMRRSAGRAAPQQLRALLQQALQE